MADKILIVDDERQVRQLLSRFLTKEGYEVFEASNGEDAVELAVSENPRAILLDLKMPGIDGLEACKRLRGQERTRSIPIIMITGFVDSKMEAVAAGVDDFVNKPFDLVELAMRVKSILRIRHLTDELNRAIAYVEELQRSFPRSRLEPT